MNRSPGPMIGVVLVFTVGLALWFGACEERVESIDVGFRGEAAQNRYLAAQRLLEASDHDVRAVRSLDEIEDAPPPGATLIAPVNRNLSWSEARSQRLLEWVSDGGHLVVVTYSLWNDENRAVDHVLDPLGFRQFMWDFEFDPNALDEIDEEEAPVESIIAALPFDDRGAPLNVRFDPLYYFKVDSDDVHLVGEDVNGVHLATLRHGSGFVTALTDDFFLANDAIGEHDHAELVYRLVHLGRSSPVWIVTGTAAARWWELLWRHGWMVVVSIGALVGFWIWSVSLRFGPVQPDAPVDRRSLMEHVEAAGRFQLRRGDPQALVDASLAAVRTRLRERHPGWAGLDPGPVAERIAERSGLDRDVVLRALAFNAESAPERFGRRIAILERIRRCL